MKQYFVIIMLAGFPFLGAAQLNFEWETVEIVDEFGDVTGESAKSIYCSGVFSNSATSNSDLYARVTEQNGMIIIQLFEYQSPPSVALGLDDALGKIKVKRSNGEIEQYDAFAPESGGVYFTKDVGRDFLDLVINGDGEEITILIKEEDFSDYGSASYRFKLKTQVAE